MNKLFDYKLTKGLALLGLCICWAVGFYADKTSQKQQLTNILGSEELNIESVTDNIFSISDSTDHYHLITGQAKGYGGMIQVYIKINTESEIEQLILADHNETPSYLNRLSNEKYLRKFEKRLIHSPDQLHSIDGISGATLSSLAIKNAVLNAAEEYNVTVLQNEASQFKPSINYQFGLAEVTVIALLLIYFLVRVIRKVRQKRIQRIAALISLILLGFVFNQSIGLSRLVGMLSGWLPPLAINMAFYLLLGSTLIIIIWKKENFYCQWACPFGGAQDTISSLTNANKKMIHQLTWMPKLFTWLALTIAFLFRSPELTDYTLFSALFDFTASDLIFILLATTMVLSIFIHRAWCRYLCPVGEVFNTLITIRKSILPK